MVLEREGYQMPSFVLDDVRPQSLRVLTASKKDRNELAPGSLLHSAIAVHPCWERCDEKKQKVWAGQGILYCTAQTFA